MKFIILSILLVCNLSRAADISDLKYMSKEFVSAIQVGDNTVYAKNTSKLAQKGARVLEFNFTMNFGHPGGKPVVSKTLEDIAASEGFTVDKFYSSDPTKELLLPNFNPSDLNENVKVVFMNNISKLGHQDIPGSWRTSVDNFVTGGKGLLCIHACGDHPAGGQNEWKSLTSKIMPFTMRGHESARDPARMYKWKENKDHIVLQGIFEKNMVTKDNLKDRNGMPLGGVLMGLDKNGNEIIEDDYPFKLIHAEWYKLGVDVREELGDSLIQLINYDHRSHTEAVFPYGSYRFKGGNPFSFLTKYGKGLVGYLPIGHQGTQSSNNKDDIVKWKNGDNEEYAQYIGNLLYFLAGYDIAPCGADCNGLPIVNSKFHLSGETYNHDASNTLVKDVEYDGSNIFVDAQEAYSFIVKNVKGEVTVDLLGKRIIGSRNGTQLIEAKLKPGIYFVTLHFGNKGSVTRQIIHL